MTVLVSGVGVGAGGSTPWPALAWPCAALMLTIGLIVVFRWFGRFENKSEAVGSDLNLVTFGFAADLLLQVMQSRQVLPRWPYNVSTLVPVVGLLFLNLILYLVNLRLGANIADRMRAHQKVRILLVKGLSVFLGTLSAMMFIVAQALWN